MRDPLTRAWAALVLLSAASTAVAMLPVARPVAGVAVLALAGVKARVILTRYLGLARAPAIRRGFDVVLALFLTGALGLYLAG